MNPSQISPNRLREYSPGERYLLRTVDGHVVPRSLSQHEIPTGWQAVIAKDKYTLERDEDEGDASSVRDASTLNGLAISHDVGHAGTPRARVPVSNPNALDGVRVAAATPPIDTEGEVVETQPEADTESDEVEIPELTSTPAKGRRRGSKKATSLDGLGG